MIKIKSKWLAVNNKKFTVEHIDVKNDETWVHYQNNQGQKFSCLQAAFLSRFTQDMSV